MNPFNLQQLIANICVSLATLSPEDRPKVAHPTHAADEVMALLRAEVQ